MKKDIQNKDFNLQVDFKVKAEQESTDDILVIEGIANYFGTAKGEDYSQVYIDRAGESVVPAGVDLKWFKKNPVILHNHDRNKVIGKAIAVSKKDDGIYIKAEIHRGACEEEVFYAIQNGLISTFSIGFAEKAGEYKDINNRRVYLITKSELREVSAVTLPCNGESVFELKSLDETEGIEITDKGISADMPTHTDDVHKSTIGDNTMKIALKELLSAAEVEKFKSIGLEASLDEEKEISTKQYIDQLVAKAVAEAIAAELEKIKAATEEQEKGEEQTEEKQDEGSDEGTKSDEGSADAGQEETKSIPEEVTKSLSDLSTVIEKLKADISAE